MAVGKQATIMPGGTGNNNGSGETGNHNDRGKTYNHNGRGEVTIMEGSRDISRMTKHSECCEWSYG